MGRLTALALAGWGGAATDRHPAGGGMPGGCVAAGTAARVAPTRPIVHSAAGWSTPEPIRWEGAKGKGGNGANPLF